MSTICVFFYCFIKFYLKFLLNSTKLNQAGDQMVPCDVRDNAVFCNLDQLEAADKGRNKPPTAITVSDVRQKRRIHVRALLIKKFLSLIYQKHNTVRLRRHCNSMTTFRQIDR